MRFENEPWKVIAIYAIAIPALVYFLIANAFHLSGDGRTALAAVVGLGGLGLAVWRYWSG